MEDAKLTPDNAVRDLANRSGVTPEQVRAVLQSQAELACEHVRQGYPIAGIGVLSLFDSPARTMVMRFGPDAGKEKTIPSRRKLSFRVLREIKEVVLGGQSTLPNIFTFDWYPTDESPPED